MHKAIDNIHILKMIKFKVLGIDNNEAELFPREIMSVLHIRNALFH
jgi:hypothetical protein